MNWRAVLVNFLESFGMAVYAEASVPEDVIFPWMTFSIPKGDFGDTTNCLLHLHFYTESEAIPNSKAEEICKKIHEMGTLLTDEGRLMLTTGTPEWTPVPDQGDRYHKHRAINVDITWLLAQ